MEPAASDDPDGRRSVPDRAADGARPRDGAGVGDLGRELAWGLAGASWDEVETLVGDALGVVARRLGADRSYVTVYHDDGTFQNLFEWTASGIVPQLPVIQRLESADFAFSYEMNLAGEVWQAPSVADLGDEAAAERRSFSAFGVDSVLQVPIVVDGVGVALVGVNHFEAVDGWSDEEIDLVGEVGRAIGLAVVRARAADSTRRAEEALDDARRTRTELLAHVSHELRTPLHGLLGYAELLSLSVASDPDRRALDQIESSGRRLLAMVDDLIDLAESSDDRVADVSVGPVVEAAVEGLAPAARERGVAVLADGSLVDAVVRGEPGRVRQVVFCAISGALQAVSGRGSIVVGARPSSDGATTVTLDVDTEASSVAPGTVMPLARTLLEGHGRIDMMERDGGFDVRIDFDARP